MVGWVCGCIAGLQATVFTATNATTRSNMKLTNSVAVDGAGPELRELGCFREDGELKSARVRTLRVICTRFHRLYFTLLQ